MSTDPQKASLATEAERVEEDSLYSAKGHFEAARSWSNRHFWLGLPTIVAAAISGVAIVQNNQILAGGLAILAAVLAAISTFLNPAERASTHHIAGTRFNSVRSRARIYRTIELQADADEASLISTLKSLSKERDDLNEASPQIPRRAFERARKGIESGEARYEVDSQDEQQAV